MKFVVIAFLSVVFLGSLAVVFYVLRYDKKHQAVTCLVIADNAPVYRFPGRDFAEVRTGVHGMVTVVGKRGDWWQLADGTYMPSYCLTPARAGEYPRELRK